MPIKGLALKPLANWSSKASLFWLAVGTNTGGEQAASALQAKGVKARVLVRDVTNQHTIETAVEEVNRMFGKLDVLVNNAGIALERVPPSESQIENIRKTFEMNFFGAFAVTKAFLPLIQQAVSSMCPPGLAH